MSAVLSVIVPVAAFLVGMGIGPLGMALVPLEAVLATLPLLTLLIAILFGLLGLRLGRGLLRLPPGEILKRSLPPLLFATVMLLAGTAALPRLLAPLEREFERFHLPLAVTLASLALLSIRDLRTRPPADVGSLFLVAIGLLGAVHSFAPTFVWNQHLDHGVIWRGPVLVLGESGALGIAAAVVFLLLRRARVPALVAGTAIFTIALVLAFRWLLWPPFTALGFGIALGRAGYEHLPVPFAGRRWLVWEWPLLLLAGLAYAPHLLRDSLVVPALWITAVALTLALLARFRLAAGESLVTGPGLLFLALALSVRLDPRMGPLGRVTIDLALPVWFAVRGALGLVQSRANTKIRSSEPSRHGPPRKSP